PFEPNTSSKHHAETQPHNSARRRHSPDDRRLGAGAAGSHLQASVTRMPSAVATIGPAWAAVSVPPDRARTSLMNALSWLQPLFSRPGLFSDASTCCSFTCKLF